MSVKATFAVAGSKDVLLSGDSERERASEDPVALSSSCQNRGVSGVDRPEPSSPRQLSWQAWVDTVKMSGFTLAFDDGALSWLKDWQLGVERPPVILCEGSVALPRSRDRPLGPPRGGKSPVLLGGV
jgi:hypothetical protein